MFNTSNERQIIHFEHHKVQIYFWAVHSHPAFALPHLIQNNAKCRKHLRQRDIETRDYRTMPRHFQHNDKNIFNGSGAPARALKATRNPFVFADICASNSFSRWRIPWQIQCQRGGVRNFSAPAWELEIILHSGHLGQRSNNREWLCHERL